MLRWCSFTFFYWYQAKRGKGPLLHSHYCYLEYFGIFWNSEYQDNEFENPERKPRTIRLNRIVKAFRPQTNLETSQPFLSVCTLLCLDMGSWIAIANHSRFPRSGFCVNHFKIKVLKYPLYGCKLRHVWNVYWNYIYHMRLYNLTAYRTSHHDWSSACNVFVIILIILSIWLYLMYILEKNDSCLEKI